MVRGSVSPRCPLTGYRPGNVFPDQGVRVIGVLAQGVQDVCGRWFIAQRHGKVA